jgi:hypothetical protein
VNILDSRLEMELAIEDDKGAAEIVSSLLIPSASVSVVEVVIEIPSEDRNSRESEPVATRVGCPLT